MLLFFFKKAGFAGSVNTAADVLFRLELHDAEKIRLKVWADIQTTPFEVTTSSSDVADDEQLFFTQVDGEAETVEQTLERNEQSRRKATEWVAHEEPSTMEPSIKDFTKTDGNDTSYSINGINAKAQIGVEHDVDLVLKSSKLKILGQPDDEVLLTTDRRFKHYKTKEDCIIVKDRLLFRENYERVVASNTTKT